MACFGSTTTTDKNSGSSTTTVPPWVEQASQNAYAAASNLYNAPYQPYTGQRVADVTPTQTGAITDLQTKAPTINPGRVVDEGGFLGSISDYLNPYRTNVLDTAVGNINQSYDAKRKALGASATSANAFGDARQGVLEGNMNSQQAKDIGSTSGQILNDAYGQAMAERTSDLDRKTQADTTNASNFYTKIADLLSAGATQQQTAQNKLDTSYEAYQAQQQSPYDKLAALMSAFNGAPYSRTTTSSGTASKSDNSNSFASILGSLVGAFT